MVPGVLAQPHERRPLFQALLFGVADARRTLHATRLPYAPHDLCGLGGAALDPDAQPADQRRREPSLAPVAISGAFCCRSARTGRSIACGPRYRVLRRAFCLWPPSACSCRSPSCTCSPPPSSRAQSGVRTIRHSTTCSAWTRSPRPSATTCSNFPDLLRAMTFGTFLLEAVGPFLLFCPFFTGPVRTGTALAFMSLHFGIWLTMDIGIFPWISAFCMVCFFPAWFWDRLTALHSWLSGEAGSSAACSSRRSGRAEASRPSRGRSCRS